MKPEEINRRKRPMTIDEYCGVPEGSFKQSIIDEERQLMEEEAKRRERIKAARKNHL
jgi:hypothetical protein